MKTDIFHLQIVPLTEILVHEEFDQSRAYPLVERLKNDRFLANPIIVAGVEGNKYLQLDGMNRYSAFKMLGINSILTQIIDYNDQEEVELSSWSHLFSSDKDKIISLISGMKDIKIKKGRMEDVGHRYVKEEGMARLCTIVNKDSTIYHLASSGDLVSKIDQLNRIVSLYDKKIERDVLPPHPNSGDIHVLFEEHPAASMMVVFPTFTRHQIIEVVRSGKLFPPGITRHIIKRRCLAINAPLALFDRGISINDQNQALEEMLSKRKFRLYEEPTIYFE